MKKILKWSEIPEFNSEREEVEYWQNHEISARLMSNSLLKSEVKDSTTITLRFDPKMLSRIKRIAKLRYLNYQSMIKQWLSERMEEELRKSK